MKKKEKRPNKYWAAFKPLVNLGLVVLMVITLVGQVEGQIKRISEDRAEKKRVEETGRLLTGEEWRIYENQKLGISFQVPKDWKEPGVVILSNRTELNFNNGLSVAVGTMVNPYNGKEVDYLGTIAIGKNSAEIEKLTIMGRPAAKMTDLWENRLTIQDGERVIVVLQALERKRGEAENQIFERILKTIIISKKQD